LNFLKIKTRKNREGKAENYTSNTGLEKQKTKTHSNQINHISMF
jgi:hypothetical protein